MGISPYTGFDNATITFSVPKASPGPDSWGLPTQAFDTVNVRAVLKEVRRMQTNDPGVDEDRIRLEGNLVNPMTLPTGVTLPCKAYLKLEMAEGEFFIDLIGKFSLSSKIEQSIAGQKIRGTLHTRTST